jgi:RNA polymerase sigma-70 factor (ECF subfamily)
VLRRDQEGLVLRAKIQGELLRPRGQRQDGLLLTMDGGAAAKLWTEFAAPLRAFLARRAPDVDVGDVLQDVFLRIHHHLPDLRETERIDAWIFRIARNALADSMRARARRGALTDPAAADEAAANDGDELRAAEKELLPCLAPMIARLEDPYRAAIELTELGGLTQAEAAKRAGLSVSGMKSRVQRGREQLKTMLLACCQIENDGRGGIVDYEIRDAGASACNACGPPPAKGR